MRVQEALRYVSRGGLKLEAALDAFGIDPTGWVCADIGASTGGFTDCLLQRGAARVYAVDVGYGQLAWSLRQDPRVVSIERTNIRYLDPLPEPVAPGDRGCVVHRPGVWCCPASPAADASRADHRADQAAVRGRQGPGGQGRRGARPEAAPLGHRAGAGVGGGAGLASAGVIRSPITGPAGNVEFLAWLKLWRGSGRQLAHGLRVPEATRRHGGGLGPSGLNCRPPDAVADSLIRLRSEHLFV